MDFPTLDPVPCIMIARAIAFAVIRSLRSPRDKAQKNAPRQGAFFSVPVRLCQAASACSAA
jgi:hypothetical protein